MTKEEPQALLTDEGCLIPECRQQQHKVAFRRKHPHLACVGRQANGCDYSSSEEASDSVAEVKTALTRNLDQFSVDRSLDINNCNAATPLNFTSLGFSVDSVDKMDSTSNSARLKELYSDKDTFSSSRTQAKERMDPFQFFEVQHDPCYQLTVRVIKGHNITKGRLSDLFSTPDPYVVVHITAAPDGRKRTQHVNNEPNPVWNESLTYILPTDKDENITAEISLMDANYTSDRCLGSIEFDVNKLPINEAELKTFCFNDTSEVDIEFRKTMRYDSDLRCSLALCDEEKSFRSSRKRRVFDSMMDLFKRRNRSGGTLRTLRDTPVIAVLGSGGGFRAMTGYAGAMKALHDSGVLDCCTYVAGLSGSSWYLSCLYANEDFPQNGVEATNLELRSSIASSPFWLLRPDCLMRYSQRLHKKLKGGQPVTFTDFFGMLIGETLLGSERMKTAKLSNFQEKVAYGDAPMPILTCVHVRPRTSALTFHDWVEFSPYEIGIAKYGTFMKAKQFGNKFFMGIIAKCYDESPLSFLMGVWGSAFSILFNRIANKSKGILRGNCDYDDIRQDMKNTLQDALDQSEDGFDSNEEETDDTDVAESLKQTHMKEQQKKRQGMVISSWFNWNNIEKIEPVAEKPKPASTSLGFLTSLIGSVFGSDLVESREYRAAKVLNYMRGVSLNQPLYPISPFTSHALPIAEEGEFNEVLKPIEVKKKKVHMVDAGLTFNSPYPPLLRPQRGVDIILSFDFSGRPSDNSEPFKELLLAEKWARLHHLPFPKIDRNVFYKEGMKECYVFRDEEDERAPVILHFVLCNIQFKKFIKPGVPRESWDTSGDFDIFDPPKTPFSTYNFQYDNEEFDKLHDLVEFNTLLHINTILDEMIYCVNLRRHSQVRASITLNDIRRSIHLSDKNKKTLEASVIKNGGSLRLD